MPAQYKCSIYISVLTKIDLQVTFDLKIHRDGLPEYNFCIYQNIQEDN